MRLGFGRSNTSEAFWSLQDRALFQRLGSSFSGLSGVEGALRLKAYGPNRVADDEGPSALRLLLRQFQSPLVLILVFGAIVSLNLREWVDASFILAIVAGGGLLGFAQEYRASAAVSKLRERLALRAAAWRDGTAQDILAADLVPGDVIALNAGDLIPADCRVLEANDFLVAEASLTGEPFPVEKRPGVVAAEAPLAERTNAVFLGASVRSGTARALVVETGSRTAFGAIAARLQAREPETAFGRGLRRFGVMLVQVMFMIVLFVLTINVLIGRPIEQSLLFAVALAVGLSPELLPAIVSVTLAAGATRLAARGVIVRRLEAIESLGGIDILCTDKTGTLTEGVVTLTDAVDLRGRSAPEVRRLAFLNAALETGIDNPLDAAIRAAGGGEGLSLEGVKKVDEIPYDFARRRLTIVIEESDGRHRMITKGAFASIAPICATVLDHDGERPLDAAAQERLEAFVQQRGTEGARVLAIAERVAPQKAEYDRSDEQRMAFVGFLLFRDPPKADAEATLAALGKLGVQVKIVTGDSR